MPTIATIQTVVTTISEWQVIQLKPYKDRIVYLDFQQMVRPRNFPLPHENASGKTSPRTKPDLYQHKAGLPLTG